MEIFKVWFIDHNIMLPIMLRELLLHPHFQQKWLIRDRTVTEPISEQSININQPFIYINKSVYLKHFFSTGQMFSPDYQGICRETYRHHDDHILVICKKCCKCLPMILCYPMALVSSTAITDSLSLPIRCSKECWACNHPKPDFCFSFFCFPLHGVSSIKWCLWG